MGIALDEKFRLQKIYQNFTSYTSVWRWCALAIKNKDTKTYSQLQDFAIKNKIFHSVQNYPFCNIAHYPLREIVHIVMGSIVDTQLYLHIPTLDWDIAIHNSWSGRKLEEYCWVHKRENTLDKWEGEAIWHMFKALRQDDRTWDRWQDWKLAEL